MILVASVVLVMRVDEAVRDKDVTGFWDNNHKLGVCFDLSSADVEVVGYKVDFAEISYKYITRVINISILGLLSGLNLFYDFLVEFPSFFCDRLMPG